MYMRTFPLRRLQKMYMTGTNSKRKENNFSQARTIFTVQYNSVLCNVLYSYSVNHYCCYCHNNYSHYSHFLIFVSAGCHSSDHLGREYKLSEKIEEIKDKVRII